MLPVRKHHGSNLIRWSTLLPALAVGMLVCQYLLGISQVQAANSSTVRGTVKLNVCGNDIREANEECDLSDLGGASCSSLGYASGDLSCDAACNFDRSTCISYNSGAVVASPSPSPETTTGTTSPSPASSTGQQVSEPSTIGQEIANALRLPEVAAAAAAAAAALGAGAAVAAAAVIKEVVALPAQTQAFVETTAPVLPSILGTAAVSLPLQAAVPVATQVASSGSLSLQSFFQGLSAAGIIGGKPTVGFLFDHTTRKPIAFAIITVTGLTDTNENINETLVSDVNGFYRGIKLPPGKYQLAVKHQDYLFPSKKPRPIYLNLRDYYQGEVFAVTNPKELQFFTIPLDPLKSEQATRQSWKHDGGMVLSGINRVIHMFSFPLLVYSGLATYYAPSILNGAVFLLYGGIFAQSIIKVLRPPNITGTVLDSEGQPIRDSVVRFNQTSSSIFSSVSLTDEKGHFATRVKPDVYRFDVNKMGYLGLEGRESASITELDTRSKRQHVEVRLEKQTLTESDIFGT